MTDGRKLEKHLQAAPTCALNAELLKREGVSAVFLGPEDKLTKVIQGPAWVIVNRD
ncbi:BC1881 family protein [Roseovarius sp.]|uniref:BC1881 family protein n=1 Tax=Roseovarius sp. TaxID=1486281 RepID=UPI003A98535A